MARNQRFHEFPPDAGDLEDLRDWCRRMVRRWIIEDAEGFLTLADDATPSVISGDKWLTGGTTTITDFDDGTEAQILTVVAAHSVTIQHGATAINLYNDANWDMVSGDVLQVIQKADGYWYEIGRGGSGSSSPGGTYNPLNVGTNDSDPGVVNIYGGGAGEEGGELYLFTGADDDTTINKYNLKIVEDDLYIGYSGTSSDTDALMFDGGSSFWHMKNGDFRIGEQDVAEGEIILYSDTGGTGSGTYYPAAGSDDGYVRQSGSNFDNTDNAVVWGTTAWDYDGWIRFSNVTIPQGSVILSAFIRFTCETTDTHTAYGYRIYCEDADNPTAPVDAADAVSRVNHPWTTAFLSWSNGVQGNLDITQGVQFDSPDVSAPLQEVVDRGGFSSGNNVTFWMSETSSSPSQLTRVYSYNYDSGSSKAELHVTWKPSYYSMKVSTTTLQIGSEQDADALTFDSSTWTFNKDVTFSGVTIDDLGTVTTADIDGGTIDGTTIGASSHTTIKGTTIDATTDFTIGDTIITDGVITDSTGLSIAATTDFNNNAMTNVDINSGAIDGTTIGAATPSTIVGTTVDASTDFTVGDTVITDGVITDTTGLEIAAATHIKSDSNFLYFGAGDDAHLVYDGTDMKLVTDNQNASDFVLDCGSNKTLELAEVVYKDINLSGAILTLGAAGNPGKDEFQDSTGTDTGITTYAFSVGEYLSGCFELQHDYKEGTDITFHVHWQGHAAPAGGTDNVQWQCTYTISRANEVVSAVSTTTGESAITVQYDQILTSCTAISGSNSGPGSTALKIGDQFAFQLQRVAASSDEYGGEALLFTAGIHYQVDTMGSRQIATK